MKEATSNVEYWMNSLQEPALIHTKLRGDSNPSWVRQQPYEERGQKRQWQDAEDNGASGAMLESEICRNYNQGICKRAECRFKHQCSKCGGNHPVSECGKKGKSKKGKGKGKKGDKGGKGEKK